MKSNHDLLRQYLSAWLDEDAGEDALRTACALAGDDPGDIAVLLDWLGSYRCDPQRRARAILSIRRALRLPTIPGPVCRN